MLAGPPPGRGLALRRQRTASIKQIAKLTRADEPGVAPRLQPLEERLYQSRGRAAGGRGRLPLRDSPQAREAVEAYLLPPKTSLSVPALEALAIVAHMQPVTKSEIEAIRGVNSDRVTSRLWIAASTWKPAVKK